MNLPKSGMHSFWIHSLIHWSKKSLQEHPTTKGSMTGLYSNTPSTHPTLRRTIWYWKVGTHLEKPRDPRVLSSTDRQSVHLHRRWTIVWGILLTSTSVTRYVGQIEVRNFGPLRRSVLLGHLTLNLLVCVRFSIKL